MAHCRTTGGYDLYVERIGVRELRQRASRYLGRVKAGESIEVTQRGTPVAYLVPAVRDEVRERPVQDGRADTCPRTASATRAGRGVRTVHR
jgi:prevent-host-death family protein